MDRACLTQAGGLTHLGIEGVMGFWVLSNLVDLISFAVLMLAAWGLVEAWLRRNSGGRGLGWKSHVALGGVMTIGMLLALGSGSSEEERLRRAISGLAPTYAQEMSRHGLARITKQTAKDDPLYLELIADQIRWQKANGGIADIYTMTRDADGQFYFLVDSETDYDHSGAIDDEREKRTAIGEVYEEDHDLLDQAFAGTPVFTPHPTTDRWGTWISEYVPVFDDAGKPFAVLGVDFPAEEYVNSVLWHRGAVLGLGGMIGAILLGSLATMTTLRTEIAKRAELTRQLVNASRRAGMAEIATGVLHNVGNALNSVNTTTAMLAERVKDSGHVGDLAQAVEILNEHRQDLPQFLTADDVGRQMPDFFTALAQALTTQQDEFRSDISELFKGVDHIKKIVQSQQHYATDSSVMEEMAPADVFEQAVAMGLDSHHRGLIEVVREFEVLPAQALDRHKILQILVNLISNAKYAVREAAHPRITLRLKKAPESGLGFEVADNGEGISAEHAARIFQHGFSTRPDGHGFGLHSSANAAVEMGGKLRSRSDGSGLGATFILEIPSGIKEMVNS